MYHPATGYVGDLNRDGTMDYVLEVWSGGNGTAAEVCDLAFVLSSGREFHLTTVNSMSPSIDDFIDLNEDGRCQFLHTAFVYGYPIRGKDGQVHNYWVYNILEVAGGSLRLVNSIRPGFPKWILFTFKGNHEETNQLTQEEKDQLWRRCTSGPLGIPLRATCH